MRLLIDMNLTARWVLFLHNAGHDVVHWSSVGRISAKDEILKWPRNLDAPRKQIEPLFQSSPAWPQSNTVQPSA
jgi:hypothetical protein